MAPLGCRTGHFHTVLALVRCFSSAGAFCCQSSVHSPTQIAWSSLPTCSLLAYLRSLPSLSSLTSIFLCWRLAASSYSLSVDRTNPCWGLGRTNPSLSPASHSIPETSPHLRWVGEVLYGGWSLLRGISSPRQFIFWLLRVVFSFGRSSGIVLRSVWSCAACEGALTWNTTNVK